MSVRVVVFAFLIFISQSVVAQLIGNYSFANLPQDYQLYPRNSKNQSEITIKVTPINTTNSLKLILFKNQKWYQTVKPNSIGNSFIFTSTIPAELSEFDFLFYSFQGSDSTLVVKRSNIVSGDVVLVTGQSNAKLGPMDKNVYQGEWLRTFGRNNVVQDLNTSYNLADTLWNTQKLNLALDPESADYLKLGLGPMASELARVIIENQKIPVAIISNAQPSTSIDFHLNMNGDMKSPRGGDMLYFKAAKAGVLNDIKTIVYIQGEAEILLNLTDTWIPKFLQLKSKWKTFFPNLTKVAFPQLNVYSFKADRTAKLRDEQRKLKEQPDIITWASIGTEGFEGLHYYGVNYLKDPTNLYLFENKGYRQIANEVGNLILKEVYQKNLSVQVNSPNIKKAYFPDVDVRNRVILEFDSGQDLKVKLDTTVVGPDGVSHTHYLKNNFFYDSYNMSSMGPNIKSITAQGNKLTIDFTVNYDRNIISYIPESHLDSKKDDVLYPFPGPFITNSLGMRAFAFSNIIIEENVIYSDEFNYYPNPVSDWIKLKWKSAVNGTVYLFDLTGREIFSKKIANSSVLDFNLTDYYLKTGTYLIKFESDKGGIVQQKIIKL